MTEINRNPDTTFLVNEVYPCLQGEGFNLGRPSILVRLQICNLRCTWCDTPYTHTYKSDPINSELNPSSKSEQNYARLSTRDLIQKIQSYKPLNHLILSGGEPTLQSLSVLMNELGSSYSAEVETNGTRIPHLDTPGFSEADYKKFQWNVSPKGKNAGQKLVRTALVHWADLSKSMPLVFFKFVIRACEFQEDVQEVLELHASLGIPHDRIFLMPEGTSTESQLQNVELHDICLHHGFRYTPRLHVLLFGTRRGV